MSKEDTSRYSLHYPSHIPSHRQLWITQKGDIYSAGETEYLVKQVVRPHIAGMKPKLVLEEIKDDRQKENL